MLTNEDRNQILEGFLETVKGLSNKEYQQKVWILGEGPEVDDFDETICHFFQEGDGIIEKHQEFGVTENQYQLLKKFREELKAFSDDNDLPEEFIDTKEWKRIMSLAKGILKAFDDKKIRQ